MFDVRHWVLEYPIPHQFHITTDFHVLWNHQNGLQMKYVVVTSLWRHLIRVFSWTLEAFRLITGSHCKTKLISPLIIMSAHLIGRHGEWPRSVNGAFQLVSTSHRLTWILSKTLGDWAHTILRSHSIAICHWLRLTSPLAKSLTLGWKYGALQRYA